MQSTMSSIKDLVEVNNIVGEPIVTPDGQTIIPVSKLSFGFGGAGGDSLGGSKQGYGGAVREFKKPSLLASASFSGGGGTGISVSPIGFLVVKDDGVRMINVAPPAKNGVDRIIDMMPDVMDKIESIANTNKKTD